MKKAVSALLGLIALSVVVRCGDSDDDDEEDRRTKLNTNLYVQETQRPQASGSDPTSPIFDKYVKAVSPR